MKPTLPVGSYVENTNWHWISQVFNEKLCFLQLALKTDMGRTASCSVHAVKVSVTHGLASVRVLPARWDPAVSKVTKQDPRSSRQLGLTTTSR